MKNVRSHWRSRIDFCLKMPPQRSHIANIPTEEKSRFSWIGIWRWRKTLLQNLQHCSDHHRKLTISNHLTKSQKHLKEKLHCRENHKKNAVYTFSLFQHNHNSTTWALDVVHWWVLTCVAENILLSKMDHPFVCEFLNTWVKNGGASPGGYQL